MKCHLRIEKTISRQTAGLEVDSQIPGEEKIGLAGLDGDAGWDTAVVEILCIFEHVVFGDHLA